MDDELVPERIAPAEYKNLVMVESGIPLIELFPDGIEFTIRGNEVVLLTEPVRPAEPEKRD